MDKLPTRKSIPPSKLRYDHEEASQPVSKSQLWDLMSELDQILLTLLQAMVTKGDDDEAYHAFLAELMERYDKYALERDHLVWKMKDE